MTTTQKPRRRPDAIHYSEKIKGTPANFDWLARFDITDGYVGITQYEGERVKERVLLSPAQFRALVAFVDRGEHAAD